MAQSGLHSRLPGWLVVWLLIASPVVIIDGLFVVLRPRTMPGGDLNWLYQPYNLYIEVDKRYGDLNDPFVLAQSYLNFVEVAMSLAAVMMHFSKDERCQPLAFVTLAFTLWKTVIYMLQYAEFCGGGAYHMHNDAFHMVVCFLIPNTLWIVMPSLGLVALWNRLRAHQIAHLKRE